MILGYDLSTPTVTLPNKNGHILRAAMEAIRHAIPDESFSSMIRQANDQLDNDIDELKSDLEQHLNNTET